MIVKRKKTEAEIKAEAKRDRKAVARAKLPQREIMPTNSPGAEFARAEIRRMDRRAKAKKQFAGSAAAAAARMVAARDGRAVGVERDRREAEKQRLSPIPKGFFRWTKARRRSWVNPRETARQEMEMRRMVDRGVPETEARRQFGSL
jgi:hypothetical protein